MNLAGIDLKVQNKRFFGDMYNYCYFINDNTAHLVVQVRDMHQLSIEDINVEKNLKGS